MTLDNFTMAAPRVGPHKPTENMGTDTTKESDQGIKKRHIIKFTPFAGCRTMDPVLAMFSRRGGHPGYITYPARPTTATR